ncbi:hypothetical protein MKX01_038427 [Papaver californicum]|nr:hypothetical protein MKX01_038427 [Papaver californicum]
MVKQRFKQQLQQSMYDPGLLDPPPQPIPSGNLPPGFDSSTCRSSVYVGNIHTQVTEPLLQEVFANTGPLEGCKLIRKEKAFYRIVDYFDHRCAALTIMTLNGRHYEFGHPIKVKWAYASGHREDTSGHLNIFVNDLSPEGTDATLYSKLKINDLTGKWLGRRQIRCRWAVKGATSNDEKQLSDVKSVVELTNGGTSEDDQETVNEDISQLDLHRHFHSLGVGAIEEVRSSNHSESALAIQMANARMPPRQTNPPWTSSTPLPPPAAAPAGPFPGITGTDLLAYERQMQISKMGRAQAAAIMHHHPHAQLALKQAMGMGAAGAASRAIYDDGYQNPRQVMYYHQ